MKINYDNLYPGTIIGTASYLNIKSLIIRYGETWDPLSFFRSDIATHVLVVVKEHDLLYGIGLTPPKIHQCDLSDLKDTNIFGDHCVFCAVPPILKDSVIMQDYVSQWLLKLHYLGVLKYDWRGLFQFPLNKLQDILRIKETSTQDKDKDYCSEFVRRYLKTLEQWAGIDFHIPESWKFKVSPYDIQLWCKEQSWT